MWYGYVGGRDLVGYAEILHPEADNLSPSPVTVYRKSQLGMKILMLAELTTFYVQFGDSQSPMKNLVLTCLKKISHLVYVCARTCADLIKEA